MGQIATKGWVYTNKKAVSGWSNDKKCPTKSELTNAGLNVPSTYSTNQLVQQSDITKPGIVYSGSIHIRTSQFSGYLGGSGWWRMRVISPQYQGEVYSTGLKYSLQTVTGTYSFEVSDVGPTLQFYLESDALMNDNEMQVIFSVNGGGIYAEDQSYDMEITSMSVSGTLTENGATINCYLAS